MRLVAALIAYAAATALSGAAAAADQGRQTLSGAAFSDSLPFQPGATVVGGVSATRYLPGQGLVRWTSDEVASFGRPGLAYVDSVRLSTAAYDPLPGAALLRPGAGGDTARPQAFDLSYVRDWPAMVSVTAGRVSVDITPHAGLGVSSGGAQSAEAGALVRLGAQLQDRVLQAMGMRGPGEHPNWYLYAGASGRAVGLNLLRGEETVRRDDLRGDGFVRQTQAGVGMSRGAVHALVGYTRQTVSMRSRGEERRSDDRVGLTLSIR